MDKASVGLEKADAPQINGNIFRLYADLWNSYLEEATNFYLLQARQYENMMGILPQLIDSGLFFYKNLLSACMRLDRTWNPIIYSELNLHVEESENSSE